MLRAYDVMTRAIATVAPNTPVSRAAALMRDLNIGDVLVVEDGKLRGIVTDRDLTINVLTNGAKSDAPVERFMTTDVVTGSPDWSLEQIADVMGKYQIRRLPIVQADSVVGIVSLSDVAVHNPKRDTVAESLKSISESTRTRFRRASLFGKFMSIAFPIAVSAAVVLFANSKSGKRVRVRMREQLQDSDLADQARSVVNDAVSALEDPKTRQAALDALAATGLPEKTRQVIEEGIGALQDSPARDRVIKLAEQTRQQAQHLPDAVTRRFKKQRKRFLFA